jgi:hypothetical protein
MPNQTHNIDWSKFLDEKFKGLHEVASQQCKAVNTMYDTLAEIIEDAEELQADISELQNDIDENYIRRPKWPEYFGINELVDTLITVLPIPDYGKQENSLRQLHELRQACAKANIVDLHDIIKHINNEAK